jgi:hypothetical protein
VPIGKEFTTLTFFYFVTAAFYFVTAAAIPAAA